jgi:transposase-like protein
LQKSEVARTAEDPIREIGEMVLNFVREAEASARVGAEPYERTEERVTQRNGTRLGTLNLKIQKCARAGAFQA